MNKVKDLFKRTKSRKRRLADIVDIKADIVLPIGSGKRRFGRPGIPDTDLPGGSYLAEETKAMERRRRLMEQDGHRRLGTKVHAREHGDEQQLQSSGPEEDFQSKLQQHPALNTQRFDGVDNTLVPPLSSAARREFDNQRREQEMEKQLRLGNMPKFSSTPELKPR